VESPVLARFRGDTLTHIWIRGRLMLAQVKKIPTFDDAILQTVDIVLISRAAGGRTMPG
jgi:hypothetical protein